MNEIINAIENVNEYIRSIVWGTPMIVLILTAGIYFSVGTRFFQLTKIPLIFKSIIVPLFRRKKEKNTASLSQLQAMSTALASTIGTGSIAGVATAITAGGTGAVFWMWVSAFFGMMTSFAENVLGIYFRRKNKNGEWSGGAMYYLSEGLKNKRLGKILGTLFSFFCIAASFGIGNMTQVNSVSAAAFDSFGLPPVISGVIIAVLTGTVILGGIKRIGKVTEKLVPFMAISYIIACGYLCIVNFSSMGDVFSSIFTNAFGLNAAVGGISGIAVKKAVSIGFSRGVFSNEAGLGSSVTVNAASDVTEPVHQGMWGIFEVFIDTIVVCTITALALLGSGIVNLKSGEVLVLSGNGTPLDGAPLITAAFADGFGNLAGQIVSVAIILFAFSTVIGWSYYGEKALEYLTGGKGIKAYKAVYAAATFVGANVEMSLVWAVSDTLNGFMAIPNLIGILLLSPVVFKITSNYLMRTVRHQNVSPMLSYSRKN